MNERELMEEVENLEVKTKEIRCELARQGGDLDEWYSGQLAHIEICLFHIVDDIKLNAQ